MLRAALPLLDVDRAVLASHDAAALDDRRIAAFDAGHPSPNAEQRSRRRAGARAGSRRAAIAAGCSCCCRVAPRRCSPRPSEGVDLDAKQETARLLMRAGAAIDELNCVRKHLSRIKGGRLAAAAGTTVTLALSDVHAPVADDPSVIGSGPTVADPTTFADAVGDRREVPGLSCRPACARPPRAPACGATRRKPSRPDDPRIDSSSYTVVGNRQTAVEGARRAALELWATT